VPATSWGDWRRVTKTELKPAAIINLSLQQEYSQRNITIDLLVVLKYFDSLSYDYRYHRHCTKMFKIYMWWRYHTLIMISRMSVTRINEMCLNK